MIPIPWLVALALQADGWYLRMDNIWNKPNPMPESVTDRPTKSHEYLFLLSKSASYYYDAEAVKEPVNGGAHPKKANGRNSRMVVEWAAGREDSKPNPSSGNVPGLHPKTAAAGSGIKANNSYEAAISDMVSSRNKRSVWTVASAPYKGAHFATYPPDLIKPCILAGTSAKGCCPKCGAPWVRILEKKSVKGVDYNGKHVESDIYAAGRRILANVHAARLAGGDHDNPFEAAKTIGWAPTCSCGESTVRPCTVLDPFFGSGTTGQACLDLGRDCIGIDLQTDYCKLASDRVPLFTQSL